MPTTHFNGRVKDAVTQPAVPGSAVALSAGFGTTATPTVAAGSVDGSGHLDVASSGTGQAARPTATITFQDSFESTPRAVTLTRTDNLATAGAWRITSKSATQMVLTFDGTPVAGETYGVDWDVKA